MNTSAISPGAEIPQPWVDKERNGCVQSLIITGFVLLVITGLVCLTSLIVILTETSPFSDSSAIWGFVVTLAILAGSIVAMIFLAPQLKVPAAFKSNYFGPSNVLGIPFEMQFRYGFTNGERGSIWFSDYGIQVTGKENVSCALWFFIGWLSLLFRQNYTRDVPYQGVTLISVVGKTVTMATAISPIQRLVFRVSLQDGERLYRELCYHFPAQMEQYKDLFANSPSVKAGQPSAANPMQ